MTKMGHEHIKVALASGRTVILPCEILDEDRIVGSSGTHDLDRLHIAVGGENVWVERRDLCDDDGGLIEWRPYEYCQWKYVEEKENEPCEQLK